jgi:hypothetical protein
MVVSGPFFGLQTAIYGGSPSVSLVYGTKLKRITALRCSETCFGACSPTYGAQCAHIGRRCPTVERFVPSTSLNSRYKLCHIAPLQVNSGIPRETLEHDPHHRGVNPGFARSRLDRRIWLSGVSGTAQIRHGGPTTLCRGTTQGWEFGISERFDFQTERAAQYVGIPGEHEHLPTLPRCDILDCNHVVR